MENPLANHPLAWKHTTVSLDALTYAVQAIRANNRSNTASELAQHAQTCGDTEDALRWQKLAKEEARRVGYNLGFYYKGAL